MSVTERSSANIVLYVIKIFIISNYKIVWNIYAQHCPLRALQNNILNSGEIGLIAAGF